MKKILITLFAVLMFFAPSLALQDGYYFSGIGIQMKFEDDAIKIVKIINNAPAQKAGLKSGDIILEVDGWEAKDLNKAHEKISGESGTNVKLLIKRGEEKIPFNVTRAKIYYSNYTEIYEGAKAYINDKYLKYEDGVYYFWIKEIYGAWGNYKNYGYKDYDYTTKYVAIDLENERIAEIQIVTYSKNGKVLFNSDDYAYEAEYQRVIPSTIGYIVFDFIKKLDEFLEKKGYLTDKQKEECFKGFYINQEGLK